MKNIFLSSKKKELLLIEEVHNEFDSAQDRLLSEAHQILNSEDHSEVSISERLHKIGFINTPVAIKGDTIRRQIVKSKEEAQLIEYYKSGYPFLKFITESELDRICAKYNLIYATTDRYCKDVPEKNISDIEKAQLLKEEDVIPRILLFSVSCDIFGLNDEEVKQVRKGIPIEFNKFRDSQNSKTISTYFNKDVKCEYETLQWEAKELNKNGLFIAAPESHFNLSMLEKKGFGFFDITKIEVKDPIVFRYVKGGVQIITKWGLEANDPALVVPQLN